MRGHRSGAALSVVGAEPAKPVQHEGRDATQSEELLLAIVPELIAAETALQQLQHLMTAQGRLLARERGVAFIRDERIRGEFGHG